MIVQGNLAARAKNKPPRGGRRRSSPKSGDSNRGPR
jgi:hypothetical protein